MLVCALNMWLASKLDSSFELAFTVRISIVFTLLFAATVFMFGGLLHFRNAETTINPLKPQEASSLVTNGVYQISRNPMYVGMSLLLFAWGIYLTSIAAIFWVAVFMLIIQRLQIVPEEHALTKLFGDDFESYQAKVRRWL